MIKVLVVDDSLFDRKLISFLLNKQEDIEVVGEAEDPYEARQLIAELKPDVITLDMLMPRMNGLTFLSKLMKYLPLPVVVVSSVTPANSKIALTALRRGAVEVICKPNFEYSANEMEQDLVGAVKTATMANINTQLISVDRKAGKAVEPSMKKYFFENSANRLIAIGSSTGGTRALELLLPKLPENIPGILIVQHMPPVFTSNFAARLNKICKVEVCEAKNGDKVEPGKVFIAPGNQHMEIVKVTDGYNIKIRDGEKINYHRPSVDVLFNSVADVAANNALGIILTGMGGDGAKGLLNMKKAGSYTIAQDEESSVVYGMPKEAARIGAAEEIAALEIIPEAIIKHMERKKLELIA